jgi:hypothetical protein
MRCPSLINRVAFSTLTTAGKPYSRLVDPMGSAHAGHDRAEVSRLG